VTHPCDNPLNELLRRIKDNPIWKPRHSVPQNPQPLIAPRIMPFLAGLRVNVPIQLDDQPLLETTEVYDVAPYWLLTAKEKSFLPKVAEQLPGTILRFGSASPQFARAVNLMRAAGKRSKCTLEACSALFHFCWTLTPAPPAPPAPLPQGGEGRVIIFGCSHICKQDGLD
jgi:hypothetical protein